MDTNLCNALAAELDHIAPSTMAKPAEGTPAAALMGGIWPLIQDLKAQLQAHDAVGIGKAFISLLQFLVGTDTNVPVAAAMAQGAQGGLFTGDNFAKLVGWLQKLLPLILQVVGQSAAAPVAQEALAPEAKADTPKAAGTAKHGKPGKSGS